MKLISEMHSITTVNGVDGGFIFYMYASRQIIARIAQCFCIYLLVLAKVVKAINPIELSAALPKACGKTYR